MPPRPHRPVALVTGASRRVGAVIARTLHAAGYDLALHYWHSAQAAEDIADELNLQRADSVLLLQADLADLAALRSMVLRLLEYFHRLDALVNNASSFVTTDFAETTPAQWDALFAINARAPFFLAQATAEALAAHGGAIVNLADIYAERPRKDLLAYAASKAALVALTRGLANSLAPAVRVNAVAPGAILWPEEPASEELKAALMARTPLARTGTPADVAGAVLWLLRDATYCTGEIVHVDGGRTLS